MRTTGLLLLVAAVCPRSAYAQADGFQASIQASASLRVTAQSSTAETRPRPGTEVLAERSFSSRAPGATLMIIGGAAVVAGILVGGSGGTALILGGVGVGAYGFYLYTR